MITRGVLSARREASLRCAYKRGPGDDVRGGTERYELADRLRILGCSAPATGDASGEAERGSLGLGIGRRHGCQQGRKDSETLHDDSSSCICSGGWHVDIEKQKCGR